MHVMLAIVCGQCNIIQHNELDDNEGLHSLREILERVHELRRGGDVAPVAGAVRRGALGDELIVGEAEFGRRFGRDDDGGAAHRLAAIHRIAIVVDGGWADVHRRLEVVARERDAELAHAAAVRGGLDASVAAAVEQLPAQKLHVLRVENFLGERIARRQLHGVRRLRVGLEVRHKAARKLGIFEVVSSDGLREGDFDSPLHEAMTLLIARFEDGVRVVDGAVGVVHFRDVARRNREQLAVRPLLARLEVHLLAVRPEQRTPPQLRSTVVRHRVFTERREDSGRAAVRLECLSQPRHSEGNGLRVIDWPPTRIARSEVRHPLVRHCDVKRGGGNLQVGAVAFTRVARTRTRVALEATDVWIGASCALIHVLGDHVHRVLLQVGRRRQPRERGGAGGEGSVGRGDSGVRRRDRGTAAGGGARLDLGWRGRCVAFVRHDAVHPSSLREPDIKVEEARVDVDRLWQRPEVRRLLFVNVRRARDEARNNQHRG
mmetsp:Transcript_25426/g.83635  ORF Transcript_25426/g.83635 Transcript_25426/m.83635 type:complete len:489 (+) Transcript_25426:843-2309(+)